MGVAISNCQLRRQDPGHTFFSSAIQGGSNEWRRRHCFQNERTQGGSERRGKKSRRSGNLVAPYRAILRYYRCNTPYRAILFQGGQRSPKMVRYPPLVLSFTHAHLCDTPFCNISRDKCAIPHKNKHERLLRYYRYKYRAI